MTCDPATDQAHAERQINSYDSLPELDGYAAAAKERGIAAHEVVLIHNRRIALTRRPA